MQQRYQQRDGPHGGHRPGGGGGHRPGGGDGRGGGRPRTAALLDPSREPTVHYFTDASGKSVLRKELVDGVAEDVAQKLADLPASQLRRFYGAVIALKRQVELDPNLPDDEIQAQLALMKAKAAYTHARGGQVPEELVRFFVRHAKSVRNRADFLAFCRHFEAVMAFHKCFEKKDRKS